MWRGRGGFLCDCRGAGLSSPVKECARSQVLVSYLESSLGGSWRRFRIWVSELVVVSGEQIRMSVGWVGVGSPLV